MLWWRTLAIHTPEYYNCQFSDRLRSWLQLAVLFILKMTAITDATAYEGKSGNNRKVETVTGRLYVASTSYRIASHA
ncbi:hypothetical protein E4U31_003404 [Claviceps sp. LM219 group G6]|nr:hypothetical protein E4U31_003404 [Claviceps sp. LM219 group G6]